MTTKIIICSGANVDIIINGGAKQHNVDNYKDNFSLEELYEGCGDELPGGEADG